MHYSSHETKCIDTEYCNIKKLYNNYLLSEQFKVLKCEKAEYKVKN